MLDRPLSFRAGILLLVVSLVGLCGLIAYLLGDEGGAPAGKPAPQTPAGTRPDAELAAFVGDAACVPCHPDVAAAHRRSRHATTLHGLGAGPLPCSLPARDHFTDRSTGLQYALVQAAGRCEFRVEAAEGPRAAVAEYAFGSGKTGVTLVSRVGEETVRELRMSYFPSRRRWEVTPGQRPAQSDPLGKVQDRATSQRCFSCHATVVAASGVLPEPRFLGVGCEACHGPGRPHLEAVARGDREPHIDNPGRWDGTRVNQLCGRCHRTEHELDPLDTFALSQTQRFQPIGLARSACFRASAGRLTCVTCHDAHTDARTDRGHYVAVCRSCHSPAAALQQDGIAGELGARRTSERPNTEHRTPDTEHPPRVCPVNPTSGCIACHMPDREVVRGIVMADHWIRVYRTSGTPR
jgi:hypothetical protein